MEKADTTAYSTARITGDTLLAPAGSINALQSRCHRGPFYFHWTGALANAAGDVNSYARIIR